MSLLWEKHEVLKPPTDAELASMSPEEVIRLHTLYHAAIANSRRDNYRYGWKLPHWKDAEELMASHSELLVSGGNRCLAGEQEVYDPVQKKSLRVDRITEAFHVEAWDESTQQFVVAKAEKPFQKLAQRLVRFSLTNGQTLSCSEQHLVLTPFGWREAGWLNEGMSICGPLENLSESRKPESELTQPESTSDIAHPASLPDALHLSQTTQGSLSDCPFCRCSCDERLLLAEDYDPSVSPSQSDALGYISPFGSSDHQLSSDDIHLAFGIQDDLDTKCGYTHFYPQSVRPSILDALRQRGDPYADILCHASGTPCRSTWRLFVDRLRQLVCRQSSAESNQRKSIRECYQSGNQCDVSYGVNSVAHVRIVKVDFLRNDIVWDFEVPKYRNYVAGGVISHNSGKTCFAANAIVKSAVENPQSTIMCFAQNADVSIRQQQSAIYDALPEEYRVKVLGTEENISYTRKNGFSKSSLILPNSKSSIIFKTYAQFLNNDTILEGAELGCRDPKWLNIGAWCDEYLIGPELLATLRFRLATRNSKLVVTFTPIDGYTEVVRDYVQGAETLRSKDAELLEGRAVPYLQKSRNRDAGIIYFHSKDNPFGGYERISKDLAGRPENEILTRAYGIATKSMSTKFPNFSREVNVIAHEKIDLKNKTKYMVLDPAGRKNWFMCWVAIDETDTWFVYREWPDGNVGDWAKWHGGKWSSGEAAKGLGYGIRDYVDLITGMESETNDTIFERLIDPRLGAAKYQTQEGASSIIEDLSDAGLVFIPAPGIDIEDGLQALQTKMSYNKKKPIDSMNRPHFYISDRCQNIISALQEYTAEGGQDEAWKDPIDVIRYLAVSGVGYVSPDSMKTKVGSRGGY